MNTLYTVYRCKDDDTLYDPQRYGPSHGSTNAEKTVCGISLDHHWYIADNTFTGVITCKKCLKEIKEKGPLLAGL